MTLLREDREWWIPGHFNAIHIRATSCRTAVRIPKHAFYAVSALILKDEEIAAQWVKMHGRADDSDQRAERLAHISIFRAEKYSGLQTCSDQIETSLNAAKIS